MSDDLNIIPIPQMNPASGRMEPGFKIKGGKSGGMEGSAIALLIAIGLIAAIGFAVYWTTRKLIALVKRGIAHMQERAEAKRLTTAHAALTAKLESLGLRAPNTMHLRG